MNIFFCDSIERYNFFRRLSANLPKDSFIIFTLEPFVCIKAKLDKFNCMLVKAHGMKNYLSHITKVHTDSIEYLNNKIDYDDLVQQTAAIISGLNKLRAKYELSTFVIWNGQQLLGRVASQFAERHCIKRLFLEISNLPNKLFADPIGVNAMSSLAKGYKLDYFDDDNMHSEWVTHYIKSKEKPLPQAQRKSIDKVNKALNALLKRYYSGFKVKFRNYDKKIDYTEVSKKMCTVTESSAFVFLPLQVTTDTQIKLHSDYTNLDALLFSVEYAKKNNLNLVVKLHPAETSQEFVDKLITLLDKHQFTITNNNTVELIKHSKAVITINSTVGLEAKIFGKEVIVLGRAFYSSFSDGDLKSYIHNYLVDGIDYFSNQPIPKVKVDELLAKAR